jgi:hypothetical protein
VLGERLVFSKHYRSDFSCATMLLHRRQHCRSESHFAPEFYDFYVLLLSLPINKFIEL